MFFQNRLYCLWFPQNAYTASNCLKLVSRTYFAEMCIQLCNPKNALIIRIHENMVTACNSAKNTRIYSNYRKMYIACTLVKRTYLVYIQRWFINPILVKRVYCATPGDFLALTFDGKANICNIMAWEFIRHT